ncbi:pectate lyase-like adhesive domain-containing protein, partial [Ligilactobacillus apodemi]
MVSKNNKNFYLRKSANKVSKYAIKKLSVGVASVLLSTAFFLGTATATNASAAETEVETKTELAVSASEDSSDSSSSATSEATTATEESTTEVETADSTAQTTSEAADAKNDIQSQASQASEAASEATTTATETAQSESATQENTATSEAATTSAADTVASESAVETASQNEASEAATSEAAQTTSVFRTAATVTATAAAADTTEDSTSITVSSWAQLVSAMGNSSYNTINVNGALTATSNNSIGSDGHTVTVKGADGASIDFGSYSLTATGGTWNVTFDNLTISTGVGTGVIDLNATTGTNTVTFKDVTATGTSLYGGGGTTDVIIDGTTTSTVDNASTGKTNTYSATSREANIHSANSVTIADGATFTLNRSSIGDGINLPDGSTVKVGDNATFTVNMNTNNATDSARYHNAGIFMEQGGSFITGRNSVVTMNTSIGQAVSIGVKRPADSYTDTDRWGGYTENPTRYDGPTVVTFGEYSTFNFTGRDGFMLGDNATFTSGEYSTVHFQNQGRGVALDLGDDSNIVISKHSNTLFESDGKGPNSTTSNMSGGYSAYNYIGVDENSNILIDEYATFRVILTNRNGNSTTGNNWDDVISLNSQKTASVVSFTSKQGAVVDIRDDNTNFYAELISFPLGTP